MIGPKCFQFMKNSGDVGSTTLPYVKALARCQEQGATMASVHSAQQNSYFMSHIKGNHWIGMQKIKNGQTPTTWEDGSKVDFTNWGVDEPHNPPYNETTGDCLRFNWDETDQLQPGYWYSKKCDLNYRAICQKEPVRGHDPQPTVSFLNTFKLKDPWFEPVKGSRERYLNLYSEISSGRPKSKLRAGMVLP